MISSLGSRAGSAPGPAATFNELDLMECVLVLNERGRMGREKLSQSVSLGPGAIRTALSRLRSAGYVSTTAGGCELTPKGRRAAEDMGRYIRWRGAVRDGVKGMGQTCYAVCVSGKTDVASKSVRYRDAAVKEGADGAMIVVYRRGRLVFPEDNSACESRQPSRVWGELAAKASPREGDVFVVACARSRLLARRGSMGGAVAIIRDSKDPSGSPGSHPAR